jgi:hypothetical protein
MLTLLGAGQGQNSSFDADYQAVLTRANNLGYSVPTLAQQIVQNQLVLDLKAGGVWDKLDLFYVFATGTNGNRDFAALNWKTPTSYQATLNNPLTFNTNNGLTASSTANVSTNLSPSTNIGEYKLNDASRFAWIHTAGTGTIDGVGGSAANRLTFDGTLPQNINNGTVSNATGALSGAGLKSINRPASNQIRVFQNTNLSVSGTSNSSSLSTTPQLVFRSLTTYGTHTISVYGMGASLVTSGGDATLNTNLYNAINTYMTNLV